MWIQKLKLLLRSDFSFREDTTLAALPLVIAFLTLLSICMTHSAAYIRHVTINSSQILSERLHLHLPHDASDERVARLLGDIEALDGVEEVERVPAKDVRGFLNLWLGMEDQVARSLPVPIILDISVTQHSDREATKQQVRALLSDDDANALLESYDESIASFNRSSQLVKGGIYLLGFIVLATTTLMIIVTSRINLGIHRRHIEILHHLGASDGYINQQFIKRAALVAVQGIGGGTLLSIVFIETMSSNFSTTLLPSHQGEFEAMWIYYILNPVLLLVLVLCAAWVSIEAQLKKMH